MREPYVALVGPRHRLAEAGGRAVRVSDIVRDPLILRGTCELKAGALKTAGLSMMIAARTNRDDLALQLVARGFGIAIAPRSLAAQPVVAVPVADLGLSRGVGLRWRDGTPDDFLRALAAAAQAFGPI